MRIKSIIVDDEKHGRENLASRQTFEICSVICTNLCKKIKNIYKMKSNKLFILFSLLIHFQTFSQNFSDLKLELIENVKEYCTSELNMNISPHFYTLWSDREDPNYYLFVSRKDTLISGYEKSPYRSFGHSFNDAKTEKDKFDQLGYSTLLYQTYGNTATRLSKHLLSYSNESIAFIAFHEATHQHIARNSMIPYSIIEAVCDVVGNYATLNLFTKNKQQSKRKTKKQIVQIESIALEINKLINKQTIDYSILSRKISTLKKTKDKFKIERYDYEINNAYLLRNKNYTINYFELKKVLTLTGDLKTFLEFIIDLPYDENECNRKINKKIEMLTKSRS